MSLSFNDTSSEKNGLIQMCESLVFADDYGAISGDNDLLATFTRNMNRGLDRYVSLVLQHDTRWQFDDSNYTTHPIGTADLTKDQNDYDFNREHLKLLSVEIKRENSDEWHELHPIDYSDIKMSSKSITDFHEESGIPHWYDLVGSSIFLYPPPSYTRTGGLKVYFQRHADYFTTSDTNKEPGINELYHEYLAYWASYMYAMPKRMEIASPMREEIQFLENRIKEDYQKRNKDWRPKMTARPKPNRTTKAFTTNNRHV